MSYVVTIRREDSPITSQELLDAIEGDPEFSSTTPGPDNPEGLGDLIWRPEGAKSGEYFMLNNGEIDVTTPSDGALMKMQSLAATLGARVYGEGGEDLTDVELPVGASGCGSSASVFLVALSVLILSVL